MPYMLVPRLLGDQVAEVSTENALLLSECVFS